MTPLDRTIAELSKLPGIGKKTALRLVLYILRQPKEYSHALSRALVEMTESTRFCNLCFHLTHSQTCSTCIDPHRDRGLVCVVEESRDLLAIEGAGSYKGVYHVLQGCLSPLDGIGPEHLRIRELLDRIRTEGGHEVILATNPTVTGDATALYLAKLIKPLAIKVTRIAMGLPAGSDIEYVDRLTITKALESRHLFELHE